MAWPACAGRLRDRDLGEKSLRGMLCTADHGA